MNTYVIRRAKKRPTLWGDWSGSAWKRAKTGSLEYARPESSGHRPRTQFRMLYSKDGLHLIFRVEDRHVRAVQTRYQGSVCTDSCVEFFVEPLAGKGYFNFETNCGGTMLLSHVIDPRRTDRGFARWRPVHWEQGGDVGIYHSQPKVVDPEATRPVVWFNELFIPFDLFEAYVGPLGKIKGRRWRANLYKCADRTSHPHWLAWNPVGALNFHRPEDFGEIVFEK